MFMALNKSIGKILRRQIIGLLVLISALGPLVTSSVSEASACNVTQVAAITNPELYREEQINASIIQELVYDHRVLFGAFFDTFAVFELKKEANYFTSLEIESIDPAKVKPGEFHNVAVQIWEHMK